MKKVVIIGGGFTGSYCAEKLEDYFDVTLIDTKNYFEFTPSILKVLVNPKKLDKIQKRHFDYTKKSKIVLGSVSKISGKKVFVGKTGFEYDYLIVSSGSSYKAPFKSEKILLPKRGEELRKFHREIVKSKKILIVGGGLVGVELASEIIEGYPRKKITLMHSGDKLIPRNSKRSSKSCEKFLRKKGVEIIFNKRFDGKHEGYDKIFFCIGIKPNSEFLGKDIKVDEFLKIENKKNTFIGGDVAGLPEEKTAQNSIEHAKIIVKNIFRSEKNKKLKKYKLRKRPYLISLGPRRGILEYKNFSWSGKIPLIMKNYVERRHMRGLR